MSLIEQALKRSKARAKPSVAASAAHSPADQAAIQAQLARKYRSVEADPLTMERHGVILGVQDKRAIRAYKILRTRVAQRMAASNWAACLVTGCGVGDGKSLTAINLAIALAQDDNNWVTLVDADLQRPTIASYLGLRCDLGLSDYLAGNAGIDDITYNIGLPRLAVIPNVDPSAASSELLRSACMNELLGSLRAEVPRRIVILDTPPILMSDDVLAMAPLVDCTLLVISEGTTNRSSLEQAKEVLEDMNLLGVVVNRSSDVDADSAYY